MKSSQLILFTPSVAMVLPQLVREHRAGFVLCYMVMISRIVFSESILLKNFFKAKEAVLMTACKKSWVDK